MARSTIDSAVNSRLLAPDTALQRKKNQAKLTKEQLAAIRSDLEENGKPTKKLDQLIRNFDTIDLNGDGIGEQEMQTYNKAGLLNGTKKPGAASDGAAADADQSAASGAKSDLSPAAIRALLTATEASEPTLLDYLNGSKKSASNEEESADRDPAYLVKGILA